MLLLLAAALVAGGLLLPWASLTVGDEDRVLFGSLDRVPREGYSAFVWFRGADVALLVVAAVIAAAGLVRLTTREARAVLVVTALACAGAAAFVVVEGLTPGAPDLAGGRFAIVFDPAPGAGAYVVLAGLVLALIVALAALVRRPAGATV